MYSLTQDTSNHSDELSRQSTQLTQLEQSHHRLQEELAHSKEALSKESASVKQMKGERMSGTILNDGLAKELEKVCESRHRTITYIAHQISLSVMPGINKMPDCIHPSYWCGTIQLYSKPTAHSILVALALMNYIYVRSLSHCNSAQGVHKEAFQSSEFGYWYS